MLLLSTNEKENCFLNYLAKELVNPETKHQRLIYISLISAYFQTSLKNDIQNLFSDGPSRGYQKIQFRKPKITSNEMVELLQKIEANITFRYTFIRSMFSVWLLRNPKPNNTKLIGLIVERHFGVNQSVNAFLNKCKLSDDDLASRLKLFSTDVIRKITDSQEYKKLCRSVGIEGVLIDQLMQINTGFFSRKTRAKRRMIYQDFLYSLNMLKRGLGRLSQEKVNKSIASTIETLTDKPEPLDYKYCKLIEWATDLVFDFSELNKHTLSRIINNNFKVPFFSSTYENTKVRGGGKFRLYRNQIHNQEDLDGDYLKIFDINYDHNNLCRFAGLVEPNKVRPITIQSETFQQGAIPTKELLLYMWKKTPFHTMSEEWKDSIMNSFRNRDDEYEICSVDYNQATNLMKPEATKYVSDCFHRRWEKLWSPKVKVDFKSFEEFNTKCVSERTFHLDPTIEICGADVRGVKFKDLHKHLNRTLFNDEYVEGEICGVDVYTYSDTEGNTYDVFGRQLKNKKTDKVHLIEQSNGQLMGNPESFVYLCVINLASVLGSYISDEDLFWYDSFKDFINSKTISEQDEFFKILEKIRINGDDAIYIKFLKKLIDGEDGFIRQTRIAKTFGLETNDLKTWRSTDYFSLNSVMFVFVSDDILVEGSYLNQSILWNNNIKNTVGINKSNIAKCTEYIFSTSPNKTGDVAKTTGIVVIAGVADIDEMEEGDEELAHAFYFFHSLLRLDRRDRKNVFGDKSLGFSYLFSFLPKPKEQLEVLSDSVKINLKRVDNQPTQYDFTSEEFQAALMKLTGSIFNNLYDDKIIVPDINGVNSSELKQILSDIVLEDYKYKHFSTYDERMRLKECFTFDLEEDQLSETLNMLSKTSTINISEKTDTRMENERQNLALSLHLGEATLPILESFPATEIENNLYKSGVYQLDIERSITGRFKLNLNQSKIKNSTPEIISFFTDITLQYGELVADDETINYLEHYFFIERDSYSTIPYDHHLQALDNEGL